MTNIIIDISNVKSQVDPKIFGHFTEHAFQNIYGGMYDPQSAFANAQGLRQDVVKAMKQVKTPLLRYPGGNFVSNYHWEDGIGPKSRRKRVFEYAWLTEESNQFGTADFIELCREVEAEPLICVNMGSGTVEEAMHWVEYCNGTGDTYYANLRRQHGYEEPFCVKYWGLGNEMYGAWQMNHRSAADYATYAFEFAKAMKLVDPNISLVACGYEQCADWNRTVIQKIGQMVDYISAHHYAIGWGPFQKDNYIDSLYIPDYMERLTELTMAAVHTGMNDVYHNIKVAWDEWNLFGWVFDGVNEDTSYTLHNAIITALVLNMFIKHSDQIGMANYSTFVNINGAISTHESGIVKRPQYHVFDLLGNNTGSLVFDTRITGETLELTITQSEKIGQPKLGTDLSNFEREKLKKRSVSAIDCAATGTEDGRIFISLVNKHPEDDIETTVTINGLDIFEIKNSYIIYHDDISASNTLESPDNVIIRKGTMPDMTSGELNLCLKKHSVNLIELIRK